jgi:hypothetical protein
MMPLNLSALLSYMDICSKSRRLKDQAEELLIDVRILSLEYW